MENSKKWLSAIVTTLFCFVSTASYAANEQLPQTDFPASIVKDKAADKGINTTWYDGATTRYSHGVLGDAVEPSELHVSTSSGQSISIVLGTEHVFEDLAPRLADMNGDGLNEVITIRSHQNKGGQIAIYGITSEQPNSLSLIATTPYIGQSYRWLAPIGIADFNNDGLMDVAYIDRPHLAKLLRVWSFTSSGLKQIAQKSGLTNHRIGDDFITGGVRNCASQTSMITVDSSWSRIINTYFDNGRLVSVDAGSFTSSKSVDAALSCK